MRRVPFSACRAGHDPGRIGHRAKAARLLICGATVLAASGCSMSFPIDGFVADPIVTGSTAKSDALLYKALDQEDWRRARAALAVALDPQGNGASVNWDNPASGARGSFQATAAPVPGAHGLCRAFMAQMAPQAGLRRSVSGSACRDADGDWAVRQASELKGAAEAKKS